jgi:ABC-type protease/lipase transport system fused ATPase/permease subunit
LTILPSLVPPLLRSRRPHRWGLLAVLLSAAAVLTALVICALAAWTPTPEREAKAHAAMVERTTRDAEARMRDAERGAALGMTPPEVRR